MTNSEHTSAVQSNQSTFTIGDNAVKAISESLTTLLADTFALYFKTKGFHWHTYGPQFRDHHLLYDEQADQIFATTDPIAERVRKIGGATLSSLNEAASRTRLSPSEAGTLSPHEMLAALLQDNKSLIASLRSAHRLCADHQDVATTSLIEVWIDEAEGRAWFLAEAAR